jgi:hypothetical protein
MKRHKNIRDHKCMFCTKKFVRRYSLFKHLADKHFHEFISYGNPQEIEVVKNYRSKKEKKEAALKKLSTKD